MPKEKRLRRVVLLCYHFARNLAYYRAGWKKGKYALPDTQFWRTVSGNFIDVAILEWCKLFGDEPGKASAQHGWEKVVAHPKKFRAKMLRAIKTTEDEFEELRKALRKYRDKFIAHLDNDDEGHIAALDLAQRAVWFLHVYVCAFADKEGLQFQRGDIQAYFDAHSEEARIVYSSK